MEAAPRSGSLLDTTQHVGEKEHWENSPTAWMTLFLVYGPTPTPQNSFLKFLLGPAASLGGKPSPSPGVSPEAQPSFLRAFLIMHTSSSLCPLCSYPSLGVGGADLICCNKQLCPRRGGDEKQGKAECHLPAPTPQAHRGPVRISRIRVDAKTMGPHKTGGGSAQGLRMASPRDEILAGA